MKNRENNILWKGLVEAQRVVIMVSLDVSVLQLMRLLYMVFRLKILF